MSNKQQEEDIVSTLSRYEEPVVREGYYHHELETIHNRILTIVFWDILLRQIKIIHKYNGILDKFIGDGIMAYFGYKDSIDGGKGGAVSSINAAFELQKSFEEIKSQWIEIWKKQFHRKVNTIDQNVELTRVKHWLESYQPLKEINLQHLAQLLTLRVD